MCSQTSQAPPSLYGSVETAPSATRLWSDSTMTFAHATRAHAAMNRVDHEKPLAS
jgi:hypothetical protein